jgi:polysaccharide transporter, PST family
MTAVVRNITSIFIAQVVTLLLGVVVFVAAPRGLGDLNYGRAAFAGAYASYFALLINLGTATYVMKEVARQPGDFGLYVANVLTAKVVLAIVGSLAAIGTAKLLGYDRITVELIAISLVWVLFNELSSAISGGLEGLQTMGGLAAVAVLVKVVFTLLVLTSLYADWGVLWYATMLPISLFVQFVLTVWLARKRLRRTRQLIQFSVIRRSLRGGLPFFFLSAILVIYGTIDIPLLQSLAGPQTVAWYSVAFQWVALPVFFASVVVRGVMPSLAAEGRSPTPTFVAQANKAVRLVFFVGAPIATGLALCANDLVELLYPHSSFGNAVPLMRILAVHIPIVSVTMILGAALQATDRQRAFALLGLGAAALNIGLNFIAIPFTIHHFDNGAIGAATVTVATEAVIFGGVTLMRPKGVLDRHTANYLGRCTLASIAMIPPVIAIDGAWYGYKIALGVAIFGVFALGLRIASPRDLLQAVGQIRHSMTRAHA